jgi:hypothetical protein
MGYWYIWCVRSLQAILTISKIYTTEDKELEETIFSVMEPDLDLWHHVYQDNCYNSAEIAEKLLLRKMSLQNNQDQ